MKTRKLKPRPKPIPTRKIPYAFGAYHAFWLFHEGERDYNDYDDLLPRRDAPVSLSDDIVQMLGQPLYQVASINPANPDGWLGFNLNTFGPTIVNQSGGAAFSAACRKAAQGWAHGAEPLVITHGTYTIYGSHKPPKPYRFKIRRNLLVQNMETLAGWGDKAATGAFFILHLGI